MLVEKVVRVFEEGRVVGSCLARVRRSSWDDRRTLFYYLRCNSGVAQVERTVTTPDMTCSGPLKQYNCTFKL